MRATILVSSVLVSVVSLLLPGDFARGQTSLQLISGGFSNPLYATAIPGDTNRLFVLEQGSTGTARIRTIDLTNNTTSTFMTITGLSTGGERGLLGLAFHPDYQTNGFFYTYVSVPGGPQNHVSAIRRYRVAGDPATSNMGDPLSVFPIWSFNQPFSNHNGGWMGFNPSITGTESRYLYIASGDGGSGGDPGNRAQQITNQPLGKMLRIDVDGDDFPADPNRNYANPPTNPFVGRTGDDEIWAYGLRNHWRNSFDRATGDLWIADVGQDTREEINWQRANSPGGENYGWRVMEGNFCYDNSQAGGNPPCNSPSFTPPVYDYPRSSVTGGYVYHGSIAQYRGHYFFGDFGNNGIWTLDPYAVNIPASVLNKRPELPLSSGVLSGISSFGEDASGELYLTNYSGGSVYRVSSTARPIVWNGNAAVGVAGDGASWGDANNWTRNNVVDTGFVTRDETIFAPGSTVSNINLQSNRSVGGVVFQASYRLTGNQLTVLSGNIAVVPGVTASIDSSLTAENANRSLRKLGGGRLNVNGTTGQTVVLEGTLGGTGTVAHLRAFDGSTVSPGESVGQLRVSQNYRQESGATLEIELNGLMPATEHDQLAVTGTATLAGNLRIDPLAGYSDPTAPGTIHRFDLMTAGGPGQAIQGSFQDVFYDGSELVPLGTVNPNGSFTSFAGGSLFRSLNYSANAVTLVHYSALPGDANGDGVVDGTDFGIWNSNKFTTGTTWLTGDFNGDGVTDGSDFGVWNSNKFSSVDRALLVPEPAAGGLLLLGFGFLAAVRRLRRN